MDSADVKRLFKGVAVVIDDELENKNSFINKILKQLDDAFIPFVKYSNLPDRGIIENLNNISFILLDWNLVGNAISQEEIKEGIKLPAGIRDTNDNANIEFLKIFYKQCFCPIFIFTNENQDEILNLLKRNKLYKKDKCSVFLVKSKAEIVNSDLFDVLGEWLKNTTPIYLLKEWDMAYQRAKSNLFIDFQNRTPYWVRVLWNTYICDKVNPSVEFGDFILKSIQAQITPLKLNEDLISSISEDINSKKELIDCLERQCYIENSFLEPDTVGTGDIFEKNGEIYINIRPCCDLIPRKEQDSIDSVDLYLLKGERMKNLEKIGKLFSSKHGHFFEHDNNAMFYPICGKSLITFNFKNLIIKSCGEIKQYRTGRLLHPFITKLQMKYASYLQRQGLPRLPNALFGISENEGNDI